MLDTELSGAAGADEVASNDEGQVDWEKKAADLETALTEAKSALETEEAEGKRNLRRQSSSLTTQINTERARADATESNWESRFHVEKMQGMEELEAVNYENSLLKGDLDKANTQMAQLQTATQEARSAAGWIQHFATKGISADRLNMTGNLQDLSDSGYEAERVDRAAERVQMADMTTQVEQLTESLTALQAGEVDPNAIALQAGDLTPPAVAVHTPGAQAGERSMDEALEAAKQWFGGEKPSEDMLYGAVEHGQLPSSVLPFGLESMPRSDEE